MRLAALVLLLLAACQETDVSRTIGARCEDNGNCDERCLVDGDDYPGGFCTLSCNTKDDCPSGSTCADRSGGVCLYECTSDPDCTFLGNHWGCEEDDLLGGGIKVMVCRGHF